MVFAIGDNYCQSAHFRLDKKTPTSAKSLMIVYVRSRPMFLVPTCGCRRRLPHKGCDLSSIFVDANLFLPSQTSVTQLLPGGLEANFWDNGYLLGRPIVRRVEPQVRCPHQSAGKEGGGQNLKTMRCSGAWRCFPPQRCTSTQQTLS